MLYAIDATFTLRAHYTPYADASDMPSALPYADDAMSTAHDERQRYMLYYVTALRACQLFFILLLMLSP